MFKKTPSFSSALLWDALADNKTGCRLCHHRCHLKPGQFGKCGVRYNDQGALTTLAFSHIGAANLDPVEKKPLYHFHPGSLAFSVGTEGCNFSCDFCQNHDLSQRIKQQRKLSGGYAITPDLLVKTAVDAGAASIAYTYSEPTIFFELVHETARAASEAGLKNILVSNASATPECLEELAPLIQAANFDLKAWSDDFYRQCGGNLGLVLETIKLAKSYGLWIEITTLLIPGRNDAPQELARLSSFIAKELGPHTPWHLSRYHPCYRSSVPATPLESLERAAEIGRSNGLAHIYLGNVPRHPLANTWCASCGELLIARNGYAVKNYAGSRCPSCGQPLGGVGLTP